MNFLKKLFGGGGSAPSKQHDTVVYEGFSITPTPNQSGNGWSTEATISKVIDDEEKSHHFIRADSSSTEEGAVTLIISKCQVLIDQQGDRIFK